MLLIGLIEVQSGNSQFKAWIKLEPLVRQKWDVLARVFR